MSRRQHATARVSVLLTLAFVGAVAWLRQGRAANGGLTKQEPADTAFLITPMQRDVTRAVKAAFPTSIPGPDAAVRVLKAMRPFGLGRTNVVYGHSICSDEINGDRGHVSTVLTRYYGTNFFLGGLGGVPFVGKTGFGAFSAHAPDGGHVVLLFGPHIGFSPNGEPGKYKRDGQAVASSACGAAVAAYGQLTAGQKMGFDARDMQQSWLREKLRPYCDEIEKSGSQMVTLATKVYKIIEEEIFKIANTDFGDGNLVLVGGITINMPYPMPGYFVPQHFSIRSKTRTAFNLMPAFS